MPINIDEATVFIYCFVNYSGKKHQLWRSLEGVSINSDYLNAFESSYQTSYFTFEMVLLFDDHMKPAIYFEEES